MIILNHTSQQSQYEFIMGSEYYVDLEEYLCHRFSGHIFMTHDFTEGQPGKLTVKITISDNHQVALFRNMKSFFDDRNIQLNIRCHAWIDKRIESLKLLKTLFKL